MDNSNQKRKGGSVLQAFALLFVIGTVLAILLPRSNEWLEPVPTRAPSAGHVHSGTHAHVESSEGEAPDPY